MPGQGTGTLDFGAFPGKTDVTLVITGQSGIAGASLVEAWIFPTDTADHSADEHWVDPPDVVAGNVTEGWSFTIYGVVKNRTDANPISDSTRAKNVNCGRLYGQWTVAWVWN